MKKGMLFAWAMFMFLAACSEEKKKVDEEVKTETFDGVTIMVEGVFKENDRFSVSYERSESGYYPEDKKVEKFVCGAPVLQKLVFEIPEDVEPSGLKVNFGINKNQKEITIKNISVSYGNKIIDGDNEAFRKYFNLRNQMEYDESKFVYVITPDMDYKPSISGNEELRKELNELMIPSQASEK